MLHKTFLLAVAAIFCLANTGSADLFQSNVTIDSALSGTGSSGTGSATALFDTDTGIMTIDGSFAGLTGTSSNAHLHGFAAPGDNGGVLFGLTFDSAVMDGTFSGTGTITTDDASFTSTLGGQTYINIHSSTSPGGEIRGHLSSFSAVPEPGSAVMLLVGLAAGVARRRRR